jgi:tetratricopeptide (TPR) repeat protein
MKPGKSLLIITLIFVLNACASLGIFSGAKNEFDQGMAFFNRGHYEKAIPHFEKATEIDPDFADAYLYLGKSYLNLSKWGQAIAPLRTALRLSPDKSKIQIVSILADALFGAASSEIKKGNFQTSIGFLKDALELQPQSERAKNELFSTLITFGGQLLSKGNVTQAITTFNEAIQLSPNNATGYLWLSKAFFKGGDYMKALQSVKNAIQIDPTNINAQSFFRELMSK